MNTVITGRIIPGFGIAAGNLDKQLPLIAEEFPEIELCHRGSINMLLDYPLRIDKPDFITTTIDWGEQQETFHLTRIRIEPIIDPDNPAMAFPQHPAWIYGPQNSKHRQDPFHIEIIAEKLALANATHCRLHLARPARQVPWLVID
jgi:hypothetical protein